MAEKRRTFIKEIALGTFSLGLGGAGLLKAESIKKTSDISMVSFLPGTDRRQLIYDVMKPFEKEIEAGIKNKQVVIKTNCVWHGNPLCATHPDAIKGVLDFLKPIYDKTVIIGESTASPNGTDFCFEEYGYKPIEKEFNCRLVDLNTDKWTNLWITDGKGHPLDVKIINTFLNPDNYIISLARMKTHNCVVTTLAFKNMIMGSPLNLTQGMPGFIQNQYEKGKMHSGDVNGINYNMYLIAHKVRPDFSVIDGFESMEGNGPNNGTPLEHKIALAGTDVVSVDRIGSELMGVNYEDIGFLQWCANAGFGQGNKEKIKIIGPDPSKYVIKYKMNENIDWQLGWKKTKS